jgi:uncharacterized Fe-S cluster-containing radical SAM superfamily protein
MSIKKHLIAYIVLGLGLALALVAVTISLNKTNELVQDRANDVIAGCERSNDLRELVQDTNHTLAILVQISLQGADRDNLTPEQQASYDIFAKQLEKLKTPIETIDCKAAYGGS